MDSKKVYLKVTMMDLTRDLEWEKKMESLLERLKAL